MQHRTYSSFKRKVDHCEHLGVLVGRLLAFVVWLAALHLLSWLIEFELTGWGQSMTSWKRCKIQSRRGVQLLSWIQETISTLLEFKMSCFEYTYIYSYLIMQGELLYSAITGEFYIPLSWLMLDISDGLSTFQSWTLLDDRCLRCRAGNIWKDICTLASSCLSWSKTLCNQCKACSCDKAPLTLIEYRDSIFWQSFR